MRKVEHFYQNATLTFTVLAGKGNGLIKISDSWKCLAGEIYSASVMGSRRDAIAEGKERKEKKKKMGKSVQRSEKKVFVEKEQSLDDLLLFFWLEVLFNLRKWTVHISLICI